MRQPTVRCLNWRPFGKNTLRGFATFDLVAAELLDCALHEKTGSRGIAPLKRAFQTGCLGGTRRISEGTPR